MPSLAFAQVEATPPQQDTDGYYLLDSVADLEWFSAHVNNRTNATTAVNARLVADIDLNPGISFAYTYETGKITVSKGEQSFELGSGLKGTTLGVLDIAETKFTLNKWTPIGTKTKPYAGTFDGNGHTIDGVYVNDDTIGYAGLFGYIGDSKGNKTFSGCVQNLTVGADSLILGYTCGSSGSTGGIAAAVSSIDTIKDCVNRATVVGKSVSIGFNSDAVRKGMVGGIVGCISGTAQNCENYGTVVSDNYAGGIAGNLTGASGSRYLSLVNCNNHGNVYADETSTVEGAAAGIVANSGGDATTENKGGLIQGCMNFGEVRGYNAAGILYNSRQNATVQFCANRGAVEAIGIASGLVGCLDWQQSYLYASYNAGTVNSGSAKAYPVAGSVRQHLSYFATHAVEKCYNDSTIFPCENSALAGANITLSNCQSVSTSVFASGEAAYKMCITGFALWRQNLENPYEEGKVAETYPTTTGTRGVSYITHYCCHTDSSKKEADKKMLYSNSSVNITDEHTPGADGKCTHCGKDTRKPIFTADVLTDAKVGENYSACIYVEDGIPSLSGDIKAVVSETDSTAYTFGKGLTGKAEYTYIKGYYYVIYGTPTESGTLTFALSATNTNGTTVKSYTLKIDPADALEIETDGKLPNATVGEAYSETLSVNSSLSASWTLGKWQALPTGLTLNGETGVISGTPTAEAEKYSFTVNVSCGGQTATKQFTLTVLPVGGCTHKEMRLIEGTEATCQKDGVADYYYCDTCGDYFYDISGNAQIYSIEYALKSELKTSVMHKDEDNDSSCDFCNKLMPIFKQVTAEKEIVYGGTYIFVTEIGDKYYALTAPPMDEKSTGRSYNSSQMTIAEITPETDGSFKFKTLEKAKVMMLKTEFASQNDSLDAGLPRYGLNTIIGNVRYGLQDAGDYFWMYPNELAKYGYRISLANDKTALVGSIYQNWWSDGSTSSGKLKAFNVDSTAFMTLATAGDFKGEDMTEYPIYLYKMTDVGTTTSGKTYTVSDSTSTVDTDKYDGMATNYESASLSNVSGLSNAISSNVVADAVSNAGTEQTSFTVEAYTEIAVVSNKTETDTSGSKTPTELTYSVTPYISISDADGTSIATQEISDSDLNGEPLTVTLHTGGINPQQVIHYKNDGTKEYFYSEGSEQAQGGAETFEYSSVGSVGSSDGDGFVTITIIDFSEIKILATAESETDAVTENAIRYSAGNLEIDCKNAGTYALVFVVYDENGKMTKIKTLSQAFSAGTNKNVTIPGGITISKGNKILLLDSLSTFKPMCKAFEVE